MSQHTTASIGIDLGTTNSVVAFSADGMHAEIIPNDAGDRLTPSAVFEKDSELFIGASAIERGSHEPTFLHRSFKRSMGDSDYAIQYSSKVLRYLVQNTAQFMGADKLQAVVTVPAYFDGKQRQATIDACKLADLTVLRLINEPTAAALAYGAGKQGKERVLVFDLGGGTFDCTILELHGDDFRVLSTRGNTILGGDDIDQSIASYVETKLDIDNLSPEEFFELLAAAEMAKRKFSVAGVDVAKINLSGYGTYSLSRQEFVDITLPWLEKCHVTMNEAMLDAGLKYNSLDHIVLVGGSTKMPLVHSCIKEWTDMEPSRGINPDEAVAVGAALQAANLSGSRTEKLLLVDVIPLSLSVEVVNNLTEVMIRRNTSIPAQITKRFSTSEDNQESVAIKVRQGERARASDNRLIGKFKLADIEKAPAGDPKIDVIFGVDTNGILKVKAIDTNTQQEREIIIDGANELTDVDIESAVEDSLKNKIEDRQFSEVTKLITTVNLKIKQLQLTIDKSSKILSEKTVEAIIEAIKELENLRKIENLEAIQGGITIADDLSKEAAKEIRKFAQEAIGE